MEGVSDQLPAQPDQPAPEMLRFDNDFLTICDGTGRPAVIDRL